MSISTPAQSLPSAIEVETIEVRAASPEAPAPSHAVQRLSRRCSRRAPLIASG
jgi:hypothetical protein